MGKGVWAVVEEGHPYLINPKTNDSSQRWCFFIAVGRPCKLPNSLMGIWPFVEMAIAQEKSKTREVGTECLILLPVDDNHQKDLMVEKVFLVVRKGFGYAEWSMVIQIDGAKPYFKASVQAQI